ncbi:MAG: TlpA disulfide reductase family protein, partial [Armatimonadota bacterium]
KRNKTYVVEFWATWCGPCRFSIPHVTELAKKFKDVTFIGVGVREDDDGKNVKKFIAEMGDKMNYNVGYSGNKTGMYLTWMKATGQTFIPNAYIVRNHKILWIGHPLDMDQPLAEIKAGTFNVSSAKTKFHDAKVKAKLDADIQAARDEIYSLIRDGKESEAKVKIDQLGAKYPTAKRDDLLEYLKTQGQTLRLNKVVELIKAQKFDEAKVKLAEFKQRYPTHKTDAYEFVILAGTDPVTWRKRLHELIAKNDAESFQTIGSAIFRLGSATEVTPQAQEIIDAILATTQKNELDKYWAVSLYYRTIGDYKKSLAFLDNAIAAFPISIYKNEPQFMETMKKLRPELVEKSKG